MKIWKAALLLALVSPPAASAAEAVRCAGFSARVIETRPLYAPSTNLEATQVRTGRAVLVAPGVRELDVLAVGPAMGSMDFTGFASSLSCRAAGGSLDVVFTITRSENYHGAALKNVDWRPSAVLRISTQHSSVRLHFAWRLRSSGGAAVDVAPAPGGAPVHFPVRATETISFKDDWGLVQLWPGLAMARWVPPWGKRSKNRAGRRGPRDHGRPCALSSHGWLASRGLGRGYFAGECRPGGTGDAAGADS